MDESYYIVSRENGNEREYVYGLSGDEIVCGSNFFHAFAFGTRDAAQGVIDDGFKAIGIFDFKVSKCGPVGMSDNLNGVCK